MIVCTKLHAAEPWVNGQPDRNRQKLRRNFVLGMDGDPGALVIGL
jgi:hypothetical protein